MIVPFNKFMFNSSNSLFSIFASTLVSGVCFGFHFLVLLCSALWLHLQVVGVSGKKRVIVHLKVSTWCVLWEKSRLISAGFCDH